MLHYIKRSAVLLFALPVAALADPVTVTTHATGTTFIVDKEVVLSLGLAYPQTANPYDPLYLPYDLTVTTTYDSDKALIRSDFASGYANPTVVDFRLGDQAFHYAGKSSGEARLDTTGGNDRFSSLVSGIEDGNFHGNSLTFQINGAGPAGSLGAGDVLAARTIGNGAGFTGGISISAAYRDLDSPYIPSFIFDDSQHPGTFSLQVSPVPEPATYAMLGGGLLFLGLGRRLRGKKA
jgi:hypothetical protein